MCHRFRFSSIWSFLSPFIEFHLADGSRRVQDGGGVGQAAHDATDSSQASGGHAAWGFVVFGLLWGRFRIRISKRDGKIQATCIISAFIK
jgi:hypothetical protein